MARLHINLGDTTDTTVRHTDGWMGYSEQAIDLVEHIIITNGKLLLGTYS